MASSKSREQTFALAELANLSAVNLRLTFAEQGQRSNQPRPSPCDGKGRFSPPKAEVCNQKAEVDEGAGEGAEALPTHFYNDLQCFVSHQCPCFQWVTIKITSVTTEVGHAKQKGCVQTGLRVNSRRLAWWRVLRANQTSLSSRSSVGIGATFSVQAMHRRPLSALRFVQATIG